MKRLRITNLNAEELQALEDLKKYFGTKTNASAARKAIVRMSEFTKMVKTEKSEKSENQEL